MKRGETKKRDHGENQRKRAAPHQRRHNTHVYSPDKSVAELRYERTRRKKKGRSKHTHTRRTGKEKSKHEECRRAITVEEEKVQTRTSPKCTNQRLHQAKARKGRPCRHTRRGGGK